MQIVTAIFPRRQHLVEELLSSELEPRDVYQIEFSVSNGKQRVIQIDPRGNVKIADLDGENSWIFEIDNGGPNADRHNPRVSKRGKTPLPVNQLSRM
jgi:hypothetical protein